jgi:hypothetical protein
MRLASACTAGRISFILSVEFIFHKSVAREYRILQLQEQRPLSQASELPSFSKIAPNDFDYIPVIS